VKTKTKKLPVVLCEVVEPMRPGEVRLWQFWCPFCRRHHTHGDGPGHRVAHCSDASSPFYEVTPQELRLALGFYVSNVGYLFAMREGAARVDLAGDAVGAVSAEEAQRALQMRDRLEPS
jgi:hypothetical protein